MALTDIGPVAPPRTAATRRSSAPLGRQPFTNASTTHARATTGHQLATHVETASPLCHCLRWLETLLDTLAAWEDADDDLALPAPLAGRQALHAVCRIHDNVDSDQPVHQIDLALLREAIQILTDAAADGNEDICAAMRTV